MKTNKRLIINPTSQQSKTARMLSYKETLKALTSNILRESKDSFTGRRITDGEVRKFIQKVEYVPTAVTLHSGKLVSSLAEASSYFEDLGKKLYGSKWAVKLIKSEIFSEKDQTFGLYVSGDDLVHSITEELEGLAEVVVNGSGSPKPKQGELVIETKAARKKREAKASSKESQSNESDLTTATSELSEQPNKT